MKRFDGKVVVVAGGSSGLGLDVARAFLSEGARVVIAARNPERLAEVAGEIGAVPIACDLTSFESVAALAVTPCDSSVMRGRSVTVASRSCGAASVPSCARATVRRS